VAPCILNLGVGSRRVGHLHIPVSLKKSGGLHIQCAYCGEDKNLPLRGLKPHFPNHPPHSLATVSKVKVKLILVQALRLCTGRTAHRGRRGIALLFHDQRH